MDANRTCFPLRGIDPVFDQTPMPATHVDAQHALVSYDGFIVNSDKKWVARAHVDELQLRGKKIIITKADEEISY